MRLSKSSRRTFLASAASLAFAPPARADAPPLAHGVLENNALAKEFESVTVELPDLDVWGPAGKRSIKELKGRAVLMPLWAEWCGPCFSEMPDFARLQTKYGNDKFAIIPVLTATKKQFTPELLGGVLKLANAGIFEPLIEDHLGDRLMQHMARQHGGVALPCNLLIAPDGHVVAREIGRMTSDEETKDPAHSYREVLDRTQTGAIQSLWGDAAGDEFAKAMANGFLA
jgi:thiol-disulfide isomerase/thioredoxin